MVLNLFCLILQTKSLCEKVGLMPDLMLIAFSVVKEFSESWTWKLKFKAIECKYNNSFHKSYNDKTFWK
jgi:hypothetical protein